MVFATDDEAERTLWVQAIYRATGQSHKPVPPVSQQPQPSKTSNTQLSRMEGGKLAGKWNSPDGLGVNGTLQMGWG